MSTYTVRYERIEDGWWLATVEGVRGCLTQGRTINQTRERIREALSLFVGDAGTANLIDNIQLPAKAQRALNQFETTRKRANEEAFKLQDSAAKVAILLIKSMNMSMRDAGELLGLSHQRVHQILHSSGNGKNKSNRAVKLAN